MKGSSTCRICRRWLEADYAADPAKVIRETGQGHCDGCWSPEQEVEYQRKVEFQMKGFNIGFTGTRNGMTVEQRATIAGMFDEYLADPTVGEFVGHHGDCLGADADFHDLCEIYASETIIHPPTATEHRAYCEGTILPTKPYLDRNREIVLDTDFLIATPKEGREPGSRRGGGTWYTVRFARSVIRPVYIIWPSGERHLEV